MKWAQNRVNFLKKTLKKKPYTVWLVFLSPMYALVMLGINYYIYNGRPFQFFEIFPLWYSLSYTILTLIISVLIGVAITLMIAKFDEVRYKSMGLGVLGVFFGSLAAGCPGCVFGLFPIIVASLGLGSGITLAIMPLNGIEFQVITIFLMIGSILMLAKETDVTCKVA